MLRACLCLCSVFFIVAFPRVLYAVDCKNFSAKRIPQILSETCLYSDILQYRLNHQVREFIPNYRLWTDAAKKTRWVYLPETKQIDTSDPNEWVFPQGTLFFKEFRKTVPKDLYSVKEIKVETRLLAKVTKGVGVDAWLKLTYAWDDAQQEAYISSGYENVLSTNHDIPTEKQCIECHQGGADIVLGFSAIQLSEAPVAGNINAIESLNETWTLRKLQEADKFSPAFKWQPVIPGPLVVKNALGYLHANCGHCHNPLGEAFKQDVKHMRLKYDVLSKKIEDTSVYKTTVNQRTKNFTRVPYLVEGAQDDEMAIYRSAIWVRMNSLLPKNRMPLLGSKEIDYSGVDIVHKWVQSLPTPDDLDVLVSAHNSQSSTKLKANSSSVEQGLYPLSGQLTFSHVKAIPPVAIIYLPEDEGLDAQPIMDHYDGDFTKKLIVGTPNASIVLKNSDEIGHTIYAGELNKGYWDIDYMPPDSSTVRQIDWQQDEFVELKCKLHDYMQAWVGSIKSRYYKVIELQPGQQEVSFTLNAFPLKYSKIKFWMPEYDTLTLTLETGKQTMVDLVRKGKTRATLNLSRNIIN